MPWCIPELTAADTDSRSWEELYDISLAFRNKAAVVGNTLTAEHKRLYIVTGANQGGKTTFLRSFGQAQLMAQCGLPVGAKAYTAPYRRAVFTHFRQEEDRYLKSGKLEEDVLRLKGLLDRSTKDSVFVVNEIYSSTTLKDAARRTGACR